LFEKVSSSPSRAVGANPASSMSSQISDSVDAGFYATS
jgi:hypothetical protein